MSAQNRRTSQPALYVRLFEGELRQEREPILLRFAAGESLKTIAADLKISEEIFYKHLEYIFGRLGNSANNAFRRQVRDLPHLVDPSRRRFAALVRERVSKITRISLSHPKSKREEISGVAQLTDAGIDPYAIASALDIPYGRVNDILNGPMNMVVGEALREATERASPGPRDRVSSPASQRPARRQEHVQG
jgi:hypothetical protein